MLKTKAKSWLIGVIAAVFALGMSPALALAGDVVFDNDITVTMEGTGVDVTILSGSEADEVIIDDTTVYVDVGVGDTFQLQSPDDYRQPNDGGYDECDDIGGLVTITVNGPDTVTITPGTSRCSSGGGGGGGGPPPASTTPVIDLTDPSTGEALESGDVYDILWDYSGSGIDNVVIEYSLDGGISYGTVVTGADHTDKLYSWTVPTADTIEARITITARDSGGADLDTDASGNFTITTGEVDDGEVVPEGDPAEGEFPEGVTVAPGTGTYGPSPVTGLDEEISEVYAGWYIRSISFDTVYYVTSDGDRMPFWNATTFFTYADSWSEVVWVTDATLATMDLEEPMLPKPGVVLVKIQSTPEVYWVEAGYVTRWVMSEEIAIAMFGENWSDYIIDVEPTLFGWYAAGDQIDAAYEVDTTVMKTRDTIVSQMGS